MFGGYALAPVKSKAALALRGNTGSIMTKQPYSDSAKLL